MELIAQALYSSRTDDWSTPIDFFEAVDEEFGPFDLDPAADATNAKAPKFYSRDTGGGLDRPWIGRVWCNPPYGRGIGAWVQRAWQATTLPNRSLGDIPEAEVVVMLLPARTDTRWWHDYVIPYAAEVRFIRGRLKFGNSRNSAPFPSALVVFRR